MIEIEEEDLNQTAMIYDQIREVYLELDPTKESYLSQAFTNHIEFTNQKLKEINPDILIQNYEKKIQLNDILFSKFQELLRGVDTRLAIIFSALQNLNIEFIQCAYYDNNKQKQQISSQDQLLEQLQENDKSSPQYSSQLQLTKNDIEIQNFDQTSVKINDQECNEMRFEVDSNEIKNSMKIQDFQQKTQIDKINQLNYENISNQNQLISLQNQIDQIEINQQQQETDIYKYKPNDNEQQLYQQAEQNQKQDQSYFSSQSQSILKFKAIPLKKLKDLITEIYQSKQQFDKKQEQHKLPPETLEQHMYTYLNKKYGLKTLIIEWASTIVNGIQIYHNEDIEVKVFGKILANKCDEEFRFVIVQVKKSVQELMHIYYRDKFQHKPYSEVKKIVADKIKNFIGLDDCLEILQNMYNPQDAQYLIDQIYQQSQQNENEAFENMSREEINSSRLQKTKRSIRFQQFQELILQFLFQQHQNFLSNFLEIFNRFDQDQDGVINEQEFTQMIQFIKLDENNIIQYLQNLDPYMHDKILFSKCVSIFSEKTVQIGSNSQTILQYLSQLR